MPGKKSEKQNKKVVDNPKSDVYNIEGELVGKIVLPGQIFAAKINPVLTSQAVRIYLANQRSGTHSVKTRAEVTGSTRKIYRQKGTGRARHGDIKAPIFIGGGIAHGPKPRDYSLNFPKKTRRFALFSALTSKFQEGKIKIVDGLEKIEAKTKLMFTALTNLGFIQKKEKKANSVLLIIPEVQKNIILAGRNLPSLSIVQARLLNTYDVLSHQNILFTKTAIPVIEQHYFNKSKIPLNALPVKTVLPSSQVSSKNVPKIKRVKEKIAGRKNVKTVKKEQKHTALKTRLKRKKQPARKPGKSKKMNEAA